MRGNMPIVIPEEGKILIAGYVFTGNNYTLRLFANNVSPDNDTILADLDEPTDASYAAKTLTGSSWTINTGVVVSASYPQQTFTFATAADVYGYFITNGTEILMIERFPQAPERIPTDGGSVIIDLDIVIAKNVC